MTLYEIVKCFEGIALQEPNVRSVGHNHLYDFMASPDIRYRVFYVTQTTHKSNGLFETYGLNLFVVDRLMDDGGNELEIQSYAKETLDNIINRFCEAFQAEDVGVRKYQPFTEKFNDLCGGMWVTVEIELPKDIICPEIYLTEEQENG